MQITAGDFGLSLDQQKVQLALWSILHVFNYVTMVIILLFQPLFLCPMMKEDNHTIPKLYLLQIKLENSCTLWHPLLTNAFTFTLFLSLALPPEFPQKQLWNIGASFLFLLLLISTHYNSLNGMYHEFETLLLTHIHIPRFHTTKFCFNLILVAKQMKHKQ